MHAIVSFFYTSCVCISATPRTHPCMQAMYGKLADLSELRKQVHSDIKDTVSQTTQTAITKELVEQMKEVG